MTTKQTYRKFTPQQKKIEELEAKNPRFKRVYSEYELMREELQQLENSNKDNLPDDFVEAIQVQTEYLEEEIGSWLTSDSTHPA